MQSLDRSWKWSPAQATADMNAHMRTPNAQIRRTLTPRPAPSLFQQPLTFSTKKERGGTPHDRQPPRPPVKSAPPISRIFPAKLAGKALPVSFKDSDTSLQSVHYHEESKELYFDQCFEIDCRLGAGSFGEVFKVRSKEDGKYYAVKRSRDRFRGECDRLRKLEEVAKHEQLPKHPNCVGFVKAWEERQHLYIQTELCRTNLSYLTESNHNIPEALIWNYVVDLLMAVKHLHDHDLVHMDIKPENIFVTDTDVCKLGDFGLVLTLAQGVDLSEAQEGDPKYLAPELMKGHYGKPADLFSLGITILELASDLDLPRGGELWHCLRSGNLPEEFLVGISPELKNVVRSLMEPDANIRPTVDEMLQKPIIKTIYRRRRREQVVRYVQGGVSALVHGFLDLLLTLLLAFTYPLHALLPQHMVSTPTKTSRAAHPQEWDQSFSDDDCFDDEVNISNNSMGVPLNCSTSSEEGGLNVTHDGFAIPRPPRLVQTTPGYRPRTHRTFTPSNGSPHIPGAFSSSPIGPQSPTLLQRSFPREVSVTPNTSLNDSAHSSHSFLEHEANKSGIEPKNLLQAFETASESDDDM